MSGNMSSCIWVTLGLGPLSAPCCPADGCSLTEAWSVVQLAAVQQTVHCRYTCTLYCTTVRTLLLFSRFIGGWRTSEERSALGKEDGS